jgi:hypothetical protein
LDYAKHCAVPFGEYVQATHETNQTKSNAARTIDALYLRPALKMQGGHELYDLNSNRVITRARVSQIPVTDVVIKAIEKIAKDQGFKSLKFKNRKGAIFHHADWIAGVDYDENIQQDADDDKAYNDDENGDPEQHKEIDKEYNQINEDEIEDLIEDQQEQANIVMKKNKAIMKPMMMTQTQSFWNKEANHKGVNQEDPSGRADPCQDLNLT